MRSSLRPVGVIVAYVALVVALGFSIIAELGSVVVNDPGDPLLNTWILWWNSSHVPLTAAWWNAPAFFPTTDVLAFSEHLLGLSLLTSPVMWITGNALLAYNVAFLLTFLLSACGAYALGLALTKRHDAAFVAGLLYAFAPYRMAQLAHIQTLASFWMPVALVGLHLYVERRRARWLVLFAAAAVLQGLTNGHYLLFFPVLIALWMVWFLPRTRTLAALGAIAAAGVASVLVVLPTLLHYRAVHTSYGFSRGLEEITSFSPKVTDLARGMADLWLWGPWLQHPGPEADIFPGVTAILLVMGAVIWRRRAEPSPSPAPSSRPRLMRWVRATLAIAATAFSLALTSLLIAGPWSREILGRRISVTNLSKTVTQTLVAWMLVAVTGPGARRLFRSRSPLAFYAIATIAMWIFSFGPSPSIGEVQVLYGAPYGWLLHLPGYDGLRVPARFAMLAALCLAAAAGIALSQLRDRLGRRAYVVIIALAAVGAVAEGWRRVPLKPIPEASIVAPDDPPGAVMELPLGDPQRDVAAIYRSIGHRHPVVNGYSGHFPPYYDTLRLALSQDDPSILAILSAYGLRHVVVLHDRDRDGHWHDYVMSYPGARRVRESGNQTYYLLPPSAGASSTTAIGAPLPIERLEASVGNEDVPHALDGDLETRWSTGRPQAQGDELVIDLGRIQRVGGLELALGRFKADYPRDLQIEGSLDHLTWAPLWQGSTAGLAVGAAIENPRRLPLWIALAPIDARYLRLRQLGRDQRFYWTVAELVVRGAADGPGVTPR